MRERTKASEKRRGGEKKEEVSIATWAGNLSFKSATSSTSHLPFGRIPRAPPLPPPTFPFSFSNFAFDPDSKESKLLHKRKPSGETQNKNNSAAAATTTTTTTTTTTRKRKKPADRHLFEASAKLEILLLLPYFPLLCVCLKRVVIVNCFKQIGKEIRTLWCAAIVICWASNPAPNFKKKKTVSIVASLWLPSSTSPSASFLLSFCLLSID